MKQSKSFTATTLTFLLGLYLCSGLVTASQDNLPKVLIIGDSISIGYTNDVVKLLEGKAEVTRPKTNCGSSEMNLAGIDKWLGETKWDVIHFNFGLWDICYRYPTSKNQGNRDKVNGTITAAPEVYKANVQKIVARLKSTGAKLIWASTTPVPDGEAGRIKGDEVKYNAIATEIMLENKIAINDLYVCMLPKAMEFWRAPGDVHYTPQGSQYLAAKVAAAIESALAPVTLELWPAGAPGAIGQEANDKPTITIYRPSSAIANGIAVVVCPGGGYGGLAMDHEGLQVANWLNSFGATGVVLNYRHRGKGYGYPAPLDDAQRAIRLVRANAAVWNIDTTKVGVMGFSAGGHLASTVTTLFDKQYGKANNKTEVATDKLSSRPDFSILCYPVITMTQPFMHRGSKRNLIGENPSDELAKLMSTELQITENTPPTFLLHANDDNGVPVENSIAFYTALRKAKVSAEMHIYEKGGHGFGIRKRKDAPGYGMSKDKSGPTDTWPEITKNWILEITKQKP